MKNIKQAQKKFTFNKGRMIGDFEGYYRNFKNPFYKQRKKNLRQPKKLLLIIVSGSKVKEKKN